MTIRHHDYLAEMHSTAAESAAVLLLVRLSASPALCVWHIMFRQHGQRDFRHAGTGEQQAAELPTNQT